MQYKTSARSRCAQKNIKSYICSLVAMYGAKVGKKPCKSRCSCGRDLKSVRGFNLANAGKDGMPVLSMFTSPVISLPGK